MTTYEAFLEAKRVVASATGIQVDPSQLNPLLYPFQRRIVHWALARGRAATFLDCGLGKTPIQLEWANQLYQRTGRNALILAPLAVAQQTAREGEKFGVPVTVCRTGSDVRPGVNVTNYEMLAHFAPEDFGALVLDECFAKGTLVDTPSGKKHIENVTIGDHILNAAGVDTVADVHRREVPYAVRVTVAGQPIVNSPNHPYFTRRGWVGAQDLVPGDEVLATAAAVRMVRRALHSAVSPSGQESVLQSILLSEMADEPTGASGEGAHPGSGEEAGRQEASLVGVGVAASSGRDRTDQGAQPDEPTGSARENLPPVESHEARTFRAWGQRAWLDAAAADSAGCTRIDLGSGISFVTGAANSRLSHALQTRLSKSRAQSCYRSGWVFPQQPESEGSRRQEGGEGDFVRVDSLEVFQPGHPDLERLRDADGKLYFYDLGATRHPSFSIAGLLVHNSSILKAFDGTTRKQITDFGRSIPFRLACTATPAPNDLIELTNHAEFLDVMSGKEIVALFFTQDGNTTHNWRLKGHAKHDFWRWLASWSVALRKPSDLGNPVDDAGFVLPPMRVHQVTVTPEHDPVASGTLFAVEALTLQERQRARRASLQERVAACAALVNADTEPWLVWCDLNDESEALAAAIPGSVEVQGKDTAAHKERAVLDFVAGRARVLVSKPSIFGFGLNLQHCARTAFVGLSDSYEQQYQAIRRCWRFGQTRPVEVYVVTSEQEGAVVRNIERKDRQATEMMSEIVGHMAGLQLEASEREEMTYREDTAQGQAWTAYLGDSVRRLDDLPSDSVGLTVTSVPFPGMYAYTNSAHDIGNVKGLEEMIDQTRFLVGKEKLLRVTMPGRLCAIHLSQTMAHKSREGYIGLHDFRGRMIQLMLDEGWIFAGEVTIDKNPQVKASRTKELGLLFKTLATDSSMNRMTLADYLVYFRKPGDNPDPVRSGRSKKYDNPKGWITEAEWIEWAAPVWYGDFRGLPGGIRETDVLNVRQARETDDERHLCPLQLGVIERAIKLWSNPGDLVLDPFAGIGSTGVKALELHRRFVGSELKESYHRTMVQNLRRAESEATQPDLLTYAEAAG